MSSSSNNNDVQQGLTQSFVASPAFLPDQLEDDPESTLYQSFASPRGDPAEDGLLSPGGSNRYTALQQPKRRVVYSNDPVRNAQYKNNKISNTKYTLISFLPRTILEQFSRFINQYFLLLALLQLWNDITPVNPISTWLPLVLIVVVSIAKEGIDDYFRYKRDKAANERPVFVLRNGSKTMVQAQELHVGDIVFVEEDEEVPCDCVLLKSSDPQGLCYIETANLDGEINLKERQAVRETSNLAENTLNNMKAFVDCSPPNPHLYEFDATMTITSFGHFTSAMDSGITDPQSEGEIVIPLTEQQALLQGTILKNTDWIYSLAVYTGNETKIGQNKRIHPRIKWTKTDQFINRATVFIFGMQLILTFAAGLTGLIVQQQTFKQKASYMGYGIFHTREPFYEFFAIPLRFLMLTSLLIPVSLKVTLDICKYAYSAFINWDVKMYDSVTNCPANASNTSIAEDLGRVEYIFTDKTGTLTDNIMVFKKCSINGRVYPILINNDDPDPVLLHEVSERNPQVLEFFKVLALCNTVHPVKTDKGAIHYRYSSIDEEALVKGAASFGIVLTHRDHQFVEISIRGNLERYEILSMLDFSSERRHMSIILRNCQTNAITLYSKGADEVILERAQQDNNAANKAMLDATRNHCYEFAYSGYRVLCAGYRNIDASEYAAWCNQFYGEASIAIANRAQHITDAFAVLERDMVLVGATAIEDRLQEGVPETIAALKDAGISVWVLTGDKRETATQIALASNLIVQEPHGRVIIVQGSDTIQVGDSIHRAIDEAERSQNLKKHVAVIIEGSALHVALEQYQHVFVRLGKKANSVICCRTTPRQKAQVVRLMKSPELVHPPPSMISSGRSSFLRKCCNFQDLAAKLATNSSKTTTLAIGDGSNDVNMLQEADVGVGLSGKEGLQAARAADYVIARFKFLRRLILVHGHLSYYRTALISQHSLYKSMIIAFMQILFAFYSGFSGTSLFNAYALTAYNIFFTSVPPVAFVLDKDVSEDSSLEGIPKLYRQCQSGSYLNSVTLTKWTLTALYQSLAVFVVTTKTMANYDMGANGRPLDDMMIGMVHYTAILLVQTLTLIMESNHITLLNHIALWGSLVLYFVITCISGLLSSTPMYYVPFHLLSAPTFYFSIIISVSVAVLPLSMYKYYMSMYHPSFLQVVRSTERTIRRNAKGLPTSAAPHDGHDTDNPLYSSAWATASNLLLAMPEFPQEEHDADRQFGSSTMMMRMIGSQDFTPLDTSDNMMSDSMLLEASSASVYRRQLLRQEQQQQQQQQHQREVTIEVDEVDNNRDK